MILTNCAACAAPRAHDAPRCVRCKLGLKRYEEARSLLRELRPVAQRVLGESNELTLRMRWVYARALYQDPAATLDDLREAVATLEDMAPTARRVYGGGHPLASAIDDELQDTRAALRGA